jgi:hypothetical protein
LLNGKVIRHAKVSVGGWLLFFLFIKS